MDRERFFKVSCCIAIVRVKKAHKVAGSLVKAGKKR